jgi:hypothetical protein
MKKFLLLVTAICCTLFICSCKHEKSKTGNSRVSEEITVESNKQTDTIAVNEEDSLSRKYCIVIGSFRDSINALRLIKDKMRKEDYEPEIMDTVFNLQDTMHRVVVRSFDNFEEAEQYRDSIIKNDGPPDTWIRFPLENSNISSIENDTIVDFHIDLDASANSKNNIFNWALIWKYLKKILTVLLYIILILIALLLIIGIIYLIFKFLSFVGVPHAAKITNIFSRFKPLKRFTRPTVENKKTMKNWNDNDVDRSDENHYDNQNDDNNDDDDDDNDDKKDDIKGKLLKLYVKNIS